jgi:hypothetical protein
MCFYLMVTILSNKPFNDHNIDQKGFYTGIVDIMNGVAGSYSILQSPLPPSLTSCNLYANNYGMILAYTKTIPTYH